MARRLRKLGWRFAATLAALLLAGLAAAVEVVPLRGGNAAALADTVKAQFPDLSVGVFQNQLILNGPANAVGEARLLIQRLDRPAAALRVSVRQTTRTNQHSSDINLSGRVDAGKVDVEIGDSGPARLTLDERNAQRQGEATQSVLTQDGAPTYVSVGQARPVTQTTRQIVNGQVVETTHSELVDAGTGFYLQPSLLGDRVELTVFPFSERWQPGQQLDSRRLSAHVSVRLGEWVEIGNTLDTLDERQRAVLGIGTQRGTRAYQVWVKVERSD